MTFQKQNFVQDTEVRVKNTNPILDGKIGIVVGKSLVTYVDFYLVQFEAEISPEYPFTTIQLMETQLEPVHESRSGVLSCTLIKANCPNRNGISYSAQALRTMVDGKHIFFDEDTQTLTFTGTRAEFDAVRSI